MKRIEAVGDHLAARLIRGPILIRHAKCRDHQAGAVNALVAMNEDFLIRIIANDFEKARGDRIAGMLALPRNSDVLHAFTRDGFSLRVAIAFIAKIHVNGDAARSEGVKSIGRGLSAAIEQRSNFASVGHANQLDPSYREICGESFAGGCRTKTRSQAQRKKYECGEKRNRGEDFSVIHFSRIRKA